MNRLKLCILAMVVLVVPFLANAEEMGTFRFIMPVASSGTASTLGNTNVEANVSQAVNTRLFSSQSVSLNVTGSFKEELIDSPTSSAFSLHYISPWGVGGGYTSQAISYKLGLKTTGPTTVSGSIYGASTSYTLEEGYVSAVETVTLNLGYLDLFYTYHFLEDFSVTGGFGVPVVRAEGDVSVSDGTNRAVSSVLDAIIQSSLASSKIENASALSIYLMFGYLIADFEIIASYRQSNLSADFKLQSTLSDFLDKDTIEWNVQLTEYLVGLGYRF